MDVVLHTEAVPQVSVVLIFFNEDRFLGEAVQSVRDQELQDWELILVDDGSTDRSTLIARDLAAQDSRIRYVEHPGHQNRGMSATRNLGASHATAPYIAFLDADDVWLPTKLAEQVDLLEAMPDVAIVVGAIQQWNSWDPASTKPDHIVRPGGMEDRRLDPPDAALALYPLGPAAGAGVDMLVRRSAFESVNGFEARFRGRFEDQAFFIKMFLRYPIYISSRTWLLYRQHDASCCAQTSVTDSLRRQGEFLRWLLEPTNAGWVRDARVLEAIQRKRRRLPLLRMAAWPFERLPPQFRQNMREILWRLRFDPSTTPQLRSRGITTPKRGSAEHR